jgi:hypothetical protein
LRFYFNKRIIFKLSYCAINVSVPEWLSGMTRNHVGFARAGSNPAAHEFYLTPIFRAFPFFDKI